MIRKAIPGVVVGNMLETYDLTICGVMAQYIASHFFGSADYVQNILNVFLLLCVAYISRPIGAIFFGYISDTMGRKRSLVLTLLAISLSTAAIAIVPSHRDIGAFSYLMFFLFRFIQGFASAGEYMGSIIFLLESAGKDREGYAASWGSMGMNLGMLLGASVLFILSSSGVSGSLMMWRLALLFSLIGGGVGIFIRGRLPETMPFIKNNIKSGREGMLKLLSKGGRLVNSNKLFFSSLMGLSWLGFCSTYMIFIYGPVHLSVNGHFSPVEAFRFNIFSLLVVVVLMPLFGRLTDKYGKNIFLLISSLLFLLCSYPYFLSISTMNLLGIVFFQGLLSVAASMLYGTLPALIASSCPVSFRATLSAIQYNIGSCLFGGTAPVISIFLIKETGLGVSPSFYLLFCSLIGVLSVIALIRSKGMFCRDFELEA